MNEETLHLLAEKARPYLKDLPPTDLLGLHPEEVWEGVDGRVQGFVRSFSPEDYRVAVRPGLPPDEAERVALHELIHLAAPHLPEPWVRVLEALLVHALKRGLPPRDLVSLADLSMEEALERVAPPPETPPEGFYDYGEDARYYPLYAAMGVLPDPELVAKPLYFLQQVAGGLPHTAWVLERLWPEPPLTKREAARRIRRRIAEASEEEVAAMARFLGLDLLEGSGWTEGFALPGYPPLKGRQGHLAANLVDAVYVESPPGEGYRPVGAGSPESVLAGLLVLGKPVPHVGNGFSS